MKIRLSADYNFYVVYKEGAENCDELYIVKRDVFDAILKNLSIREIQENGLLTNDQYKALLYLRNNYPDYNIITTIDFRTANKYDKRGLSKLGIAEKFNNLFSGRNRYQGNWSISSVNDNEKNNWTMEYRKGTSSSGNIDCVFVNNFVRYNIKFKSKTIANKIKDITRMLDSGNEAYYKLDKPKKNEIIYSKEMIEKNTEWAYQNAIDHVQYLMASEDLNNISPKDSKQPFINKLLALQKYANDLPREKRFYDDRLKYNKKHGLLKKHGFIQPGKDQCEERFLKFSKKYGIIKQNEPIEGEAENINPVFLKRINDYIDNYYDKKIKTQPLKIFSKKKKQNDIKNLTNNGKKDNNIHM